METIHIDLNSILLPLTAVLGLSITVERVLEYFSNIFDHFQASTKDIKVKNEDDTKELVALEKIYKEIKAIRENELEKKQDQKAQKKSLRKFREESTCQRSQIKTSANLKSEGAELSEKQSPLMIMVKQATDPDDGKSIKTFTLQCVGLIMGIILVRISGLQLINSFLTGMKAQSIAVPLDYLLTGLLIGGGSAPIHALINFVKSQKVTLPKDTELEEKAPSASALNNKPAVAQPASDDWQDIPYAGGYEREKLELRKRAKNPGMIIYHHTAMHNNTTFEDVVRVIKQRDFQTGYNCVIHYSGTIHPFCRWDAYGTHAAGYNMKSLGLSFNGNFETGATDQWSNKSGRYGAQRPSEAQLKSGARVVTLWTFLYNIELDFKNLIIPHMNVALKACPGSNFPYEEFSNLIKYYHERWSKSDFIKNKIEEYKLKPYIYV